MEIINQLDKALDYIENNLDGKISFDQAAKIACCSTCQFQRMFSYIVGVPVSEYIRRRRMTSAAFDLRAENAKISDIAAKYGYKSPTAFNRAFQSIHGVAPSSVWEYGKDIFLTTYPRLSLQISVTGNEQLKYHIETKPPIRIIGKSITLCTDIDINFHTIPKFWEQMKDDISLQYLIKQNNILPHGLIGASIYQNTSILYVVGTTSDKATPEGFEEYQIPGMTWAVFQCVGTMPNALQNLYKQFFTQWLPVSDYEYGNGPDLELYTKEPCSQECELWMPVKKKISK